MTVSPSRAQYKDAFNHVLDNVLGRDDTLALKQALLIDRYRDICDFMTILETVIEDLAYVALSGEACVNFPARLDGREVDPHGEIAKIAR